MSLQLYAKKRNFKSTPEPKGRRTNTGKQLEFVVQRHHASRLHYDFRLEMEGAMKSWAVPKGPSMNPSHKRLAVMVEDHPYDYRTFEGSIPKGNYGAGTVEIWDKGFYTTPNPSGNPGKELLKALKQGSLKFVLKGKKLKGEFALVRLKNDSKQKNAWLLIKHRDRYAVDENYSSEDYPPIEKLKGSTVIPPNSKVGKRKKYQVKKLKQAVSVKPVRVPGFQKKNT
jgi:bifunctional non-homologous end joining protein LigD